MPGSPIRSYLQEVDQVALRTGEQATQHGDGQLDHRTLVPVGVDLRGPTGVE
ncbi:hypothetical protein [Streptomyces sp. NPDC020681]|uniref:hypothetical protein n=1 Tax=Streptomyces sp. NPDC020681 TaxID=3365083 RepID=UPI003788099A